MKLRFLPADAGGRFDGVMSHRLWDHVPNFVSSGEDVTIIPISYFSDFRFNPELMTLKGKKWILACSTEYYGEWPAFTTHLWGRDRCAISGNPEWQKFSDWVRDNPPVLSFVRELFEPDTSDVVLPLEWPAYQSAWPLENENAFNSRPFEVFFGWGFSNCARAELHGDIYRGWCKNGHEVVGNLDHIDAKVNEPVRKWISVHLPHSHRVHVDILARRQAQSKLTVSLSGAGVCCFRSTELVHTIPAIHSKNKVWSNPWVHGQNCIHLNPGSEYEDLLAATKRDDLFKIYLAAQDNLDRYRTNRYIHEYILPNIARVL